METPSVPVRTYRVQSRWRYWLGAIVFGSMGLFLFWRVLVSLFGGEWKAAAGVGLLALVFIVPAAYSLLYSQTRLILAPQGVTFYGIGYHLHTPWRNIERLAVIPYSFYYRDPELMEGLPTRPDETQDRVDPNPDGVEGFFLHEPVANQGLIGKGRRTRFLPLLEYKKWRETDLFIEFRRFAPHLFGLSPDQLS